MYYGYGYGLGEVLGYVLVLIGFIITLGSQILINNSYSKYKKLKNNAGITGNEVARKILDANNLSDVKIVKISGNLTDHYDPKDKIVRLSTAIYDGKSIASLAVAAHECGHAIQDKTNYSFLTIRSFIIPVVNFCDKLGYMVILLGLMMNFFNLALFGVVLLCSVLVFQLITLPVEFDASSRAKKELIKLEMVDDSTYDGVSSMLLAAAMTYVASVINTLLQILRLVLIIFSRRDDD